MVLGFSASAWFSNLVPVILREAWIFSGGRLDSNHVRADFCFCAGKEDPAVDLFHSIGIIPIHACWIAECLAQKFIMPTADFILDDYFDPTRIYAPSPRLQAASRRNSDARSEIEVASLLDPTTTDMATKESPSRYPQNNSQDNTTFDTDESTLVASFSFTRLESLLKERTESSAIPSQDAVPTSFTEKFAKNITMKNGLDGLAFR
ncbi:hypothetical protein DL96DRAFT_1626819 [Flagelloscypha sp. PMI_526]|nr:hypothetical protein DL96DRAFT_1626819 [Flagelloscypha sp. PMI_526]